MRRLLDSPPLQALRQMSPTNRKFHSSPFRSPLEPRLDQRVQSAVNEGNTHDFGFFKMVFPLAFDGSPYLTMNRGKCPKEEPSPVPPCNCPPRKIKCFEPKPCVNLDSDPCPFKVPPCPKPKGPCCPERPPKPKCKDKMTKVIFDLKRSPFVTPPDEGIDHYEMMEHWKLVTEKKEL